MELRLKEPRRLWKEEELQTDIDQCVPPSDVSSTTGSPAHQTPGRAQANIDFRASFPGSLAYESPAIEDDSIEKQSGKGQACSKDAAGAKDASTAPLHSTASCSLPRQPSFRSSTPTLGSTRSFRHIRFRKGKEQITSSWVLNRTGTRLPAANIYCYPSYPKRAILRTESARMRPRFDNHGGKLASKTQLELAPKVVRSLRRGRTLLGLCKNKRSRLDPNPEYDARAGVFDPRSRQP